ncbi:probable disease resistance protein At1g61300 [Dioscorea cayenensis subsp. rotundata]|uniref:Probable disease resistance protein At1g61300 n=1 Tax=Dioscorea cayennensis subsp. rotundata TaxID=55577 RepID=A0AB40CB93_DIOCR|nr:probable disease resistance protein At1g61300 [Dioscorea cayenensis subsp. rotundata]
MHDVEEKLNLPQNRGRRPTYQLQHWANKVEEADEKVTQLLDEYSKSCCVLGPCCLNCFSRYSISRSAFNLLNEITQLKGEQSEVSFIEQLPPKPVPESYKIMGKKIVSDLDIALSWLTDETVGIIGIWGMGGVGKTTLLKRINKSLLDDANMGFNHVLFIKASKDIQPEELRKMISKSLELEPSAGKEDIFNVLKSGNFVLLLDNIWEEVDLINLGIPHPYSGDNSTTRYKHKVIFTTRSEDVCAKMNAGEKIIKVECLEDDEAWDLFKDNVNLDVIESDQKFKEIAWQVMGRCGGLPLALKVVGKAMSNKKIVQDWEFILNSLKKSDTEVVQGVQESLLPILRFSYDNLPRNMNIRECFLCASTLRGSSKDDLIECWMGLGLITDFVNLQQAYLQARYIVNILEEAGLLHSSNYGYVRLHDVIYEMAMWIASDCGRNRNKWIVKKYDGLAAEIPTHDAENWGFANRVIITGEVELLPILSHQCSDLLCLMIQGSRYFKNIPDGFFRQMPNLKYLDLSRTCMKELPKGIKCLVNLEYLNISSTNISSLPKELVYLKKLKYLICRYLEGFGKVEDGLMSKLQNLKVIDIYPFGWVEPEELKLLKKLIKAIGMRVVSQEILQQLSSLPTTRLCLVNMDSLISLSFDTLSCKDHGFLQKLEITSCPDLKDLVMNGSGSHLNELKILNVKKLQNIMWTDLTPPEFFHMLKWLFISGCNLDNLAWVLHLPCLFRLEIRDCAEAETLFHVQEEEREIQQVSKHRMFPTLRHLYLKNLPKLVSISNFALDFPLLLKLVVHDCAEIEMLFSIEEREIRQQEVLERLMFPALRDLSLRKLPKLVSISNIALDFPRLSGLTLYQCHNLKKLPFKSGINNNQRMIDIYCFRECWKHLEWDDGTIPAHLRPYFYPSMIQPRAVDFCSQPGRCT